MHTTLVRKDDYYLGTFHAMASPCYILTDTDDAALAQQALQIVQQEAIRIEHKFSRYRDDNILYQINHAQGQRVTVDDETARMLNFADLCYQLSDGLFDVTSGVLRRIWRFDGSDQVPRMRDVKALLPLIGWDKVTWQQPYVQFPAGMELDFGGIGKEYAVDRAADLLAKLTDCSFVVSFGGDMFVRGLRRQQQPWQVGVENPAQDGDAVQRIQIEKGGIATSGDSRRFLMKLGKRYSHILNPKTGWPVQGAPRSVTVLSSTCIEAGMLATMASLQGDAAESFLQQQQLQYWLC